jgi:hypothetical protein
MKQGAGTSVESIKKERYFWCLRYAPDPLPEKHFGNFCDALNAFLFATINTPTLYLYLPPDRIPEPFNVHRMCTEPSELNKQQDAFLLESPAYSAPHAIRKTQH